MSSFVQSSVWQYAVISLGTEPSCEQAVIAYPDEKSLRDLLAAPSILGLGYRSREEAKANLDGCKNGSILFAAKLTATSSITKRSL